MMALFFISSVTNTPVINIFEAPSHHPQHQLRPHKNHRQHDQLNDHKRDNSSIEVLGCDFGWGDAFEIKKGEAEGR